MLSRKAIASIVIGVAAVLIMTWRMARFPATIVVINQSGSTLKEVVVDAGASQIELGTLRNGETRRISIDPTEKLRLRFQTNEPHGWTSSGAVTAGQSLVLYVTPGDQVMARNRIGNLVR